MKKLFASLLVIACLFNMSCKKNFDEPPSEVNNPDIKSNTTIKALKALHKTAGTFDDLTTDITIEGVVIMDDQSGNYYKSIVIQDASGGIEVKMDATSLFNDYPIGRKIYINCKGLTLGDYGGVTQLGAGTFTNTKGQLQLSGISQLLIPTYVLKGGLNQPVTPKKVKPSDLTADDISTLISVENAEFATLSIGKTLADAKNKFTVNHTLQTCNNGGTIILRTSGYAPTLASGVASDKNGTITGVYSVFVADKQLFIRDLNDINFTAARCGGGGGVNPGGPATGDLISIGDVRALFTGAITNAPANKKIAGVVISDKDNGNTTGKNMIIQGADGKGIAIRFDANNTFALGEALEITISGVEISEYNGLLQLNNCPIANAKSQGKGTLPTPKKITIGALIADFENNESTLITVDKAGTNNATKYGGNIIIDDKTGKMTLYTGTTASFAADAPISNNINVTGVVGQFNTTYQLAMRSKADVTDAGGTTGGGGTNKIETIGTIRNLFSGALVSAPAATAIRGIVISDKDNKNGSVLNCVVQGADGKGITIRFDKAHTFVVGDLIEADISGADISEYSGLLQLSKVVLANSKFVSKGTLPTPTVVTLANYIAGFENYESTLVQIKNATITGGKYYDAARGTTNATKGTVKLTDATGGPIDIYTVLLATFNADTAPATQVSVTGIASEFTATGAAKGVQLLLRSGADVK